MFEKKYSYDDLLLVPKHSDVDTRDNVSLVTNVTPNNQLGRPLVSAPMDSVTGSKMAQVMGDNGGVGIIHRFADTDERIDMVHRVQSPVGASVGISEEEIEIAEKLALHCADFICVDVAHGHMQKTIDFIKELKEVVDVDIMAGNVATFGGAKELASAGADSIKVGVGPGCFAEGTRVLMSNGTYKNIEEVERGDSVINKNGDPVSVISSGKTGEREVSKLSTNKWHKNTYVTNDHEYWVGDLNSVSESTLKSSGFVNCLNTEPKKVKYRPRKKWKEVGKMEQDISLFPSKINYDLPDSFEIDLKKRCGGNYRSGYDYEIDNKIQSNYDSGYIFGTFLGDGNSSFSKNNSGVVRWSFNIDEMKIAQKLKSCIDNTLDSVNVKIKKRKERNIIHVVLNYNPIVRLFEEFGKSQNKELPQEYLVDEKTYLRGLFDGLIDSDGHSDGCRISFTNTSESLVELMYVLYSILYDGIPNSSTKDKTVGGLEGADYENLSQSYSVRYNSTTKQRVTQDNYQVVKPLKYKASVKNVDVYDIEVDCETHSFIANNSIVHNSHCVTREMTGHGVPQASAVSECSEIKGMFDDVTIIADGGIRKPGDAVKALMLGADAVMMGGIFGRCKESPGEGDVWGCASEEGNTEQYNEGVVSESENKYTVEGVFEEFMDGMRSGLSYSGGHSIQEARRNAEFIEVTSSTQDRNGGFEI
jgi:IMP dehydrogenase/GMP reductase